MRPSPANNNNPTSPFIEELSRDFLNSLRDQDDCLIRAVSQFELALLRVRTGYTDCFEVQWDRHPDRVILALEKGSELPASETGCLYRMESVVTCPAKSYVRVNTQLTRNRQSISGLFIAEREHALGDTNLEPEFKQKALEWVGWAKQYEDRIDPLSAGFRG